MKKIVSAALSLIIAVNILFMAPVANAQIKKDYLYWAQDDSSKPWYSMSIARDRHSSCTFAKYGCWIMAYAKLLVMSGAKNQDSFGPVDMINWVVDNKVTDNEGNLVSNHQQKVAMSFGIDYVDTIDAESYAYAAENIMEQVNQGNYVIVRLNGHSVIVDNELTKANGYVTVSNSWASKNYNTPLSYFESRYSMSHLDVFAVDNEPPVISNISVSGINAKGYTIRCFAYDEVAIDHVDFTTEGKTVRGTNDGYDNFTYTFNAATQGKTYTTTITAVDTAGNATKKTVKVTVGTAKVSKPAISLKNSGQGKLVTLTCATPGATIYFKLAKNASYKKYTKPFKLTSTKAVYAYATKKNCKKSDVLGKKISIGKVATPTIKASSIMNGKSVTLKTSTNGATIYYKLSKGAKYQKYSKPVSIATTKTIYAYAKKSGCKNSAVAKKKVGIAKLSKVSGFKVSAVSSSAVKLGWKKVSGAAKYTLLYATSKNGTTSSVSTDKTSITVKNLKPSKTYYFKICACAKGKQHGDYTKFISAKTKKAPGADAKMVGTWRYVGEYLGDGDAKYEFTFNGEGKVKVTCYDLISTSSKTVNCSSSGNTVSFSAYGYKYKITYIPNEKLLRYKSTDSNGYAIEDMLIKTKEAKYNETEIKKGNNFLKNTLWYSDYLKNHEAKKGRSFQNVGFYNDEYGSGLSAAVKYDGRVYDDKRMVKILNSSVYGGVWSFGPERESIFKVILEKQSDTKIKAFIFNLDGKFVAEEYWTVQ